MWRRLVLSLVLWNTITSQPIADEADNVRQTRELDFVECCPCPGSGRAGEGYLLPAADATHDARAADVDDCPCRLADAEGAASGLLSRALLPARPVVRLLDSKEEPKPLLHPEVGLASSVLETLREATDEEYHDAVARDAVRSATRAETDAPSLGDTIPEAAQNIVTIILNTETDDDGIIAEASHVQEARCKPESADLELEKIRDHEPSNFLKEIFTLPKAEQNRFFWKKNTDMHSGASNIDEQDSTNKDTKGLKLKAHPSSLHLFANKRTTLQDKNLNSIFNLRDSNIKVDKKTDGGGLNTHLISTKVPNSRLNPVFTKINKSDNLKSILEGLRSNKLNRPLIQKIKLVKSQKEVGDFGDVDNDPSPSNLQDQFTEIKKTNDISKFRLKSLIPSDDKSLETRPLRFKNLLKLKDVELIPPKSNTAKLNIPDLKLKSTLETNVLKSLTPRNWIHYGKSILNNKDPCDTGDCEMEIKETNLQTIPEVKTEILDAVPSPSEDHQVVIENEISAHDIDDDYPTLSDPCFAENPNMENNTEDIVINKAHTNEVEEKEEQSNISNYSNIESFLTNYDYSQEDIVIQPELNYLPSSLNDDEIAKDYLEDMDIDQDAVAETSNNVFQITSQAEIEDKEVDCLTDSDFEAEESCLEMVADKLENEKLRENSSILSTLKHNTFKNSDILNKPSKFVESSSDEDNNKERSVDSSEISDPDFQIKDSDSTKYATQILNEPSDEVSESTNQVNIEDIQKMSDSLLNLSNQKSQHANHQDAFECKANTNDLSFTTNEVIENDTDSSNIDGKEESLTSSDLDVAAISGDETTVDATSNPITSSRETLEDDENLSDGYMVQKSTNEPNQIKENDCDKLDFSKTPEIEVEIPESSSGKVQSKEMIADASDSIMKIMPRTNAKKANLLGTSLLRDIIVQPSSLFSGNDLFKKPILDLDNILNLNTPLPILDDIQSSISSIFGVSERDADNKELSSSELDLNTDCSKSNPVMATDSSTTNSKSIFPSLKTIDDINLDIFQFSPLTQNEPFHLKLPGLNLNSYKARLALPKSLNLKPLKLQSALRNHGGLLGATLTVGPKNIQSSRRMKPKLKSGSVLNRKSSEILTNPLGNMPNMPSLDGLRATMRANAENLLNTKTVTPKLEETLRSSQVISENLRSHTENTMRNIQETLASTLHEARLKDLNVVGQKLAKPEDIFEMVSSARDDVNDKLYALHTDLTDRLTSMHERIVDQSKLPSFNIPLKKETLSGKPQRKINARIVQKPRSTFPKIPHTSTFRKESVSKPTSVVTKPSNVRLGSSQARAVTEHNKFKPYKIPKAASSLSPKTVEVPKLTTTSRKPSFSTPLQRDVSVQLKKSSPLTSAINDHGNKLFKNIKRPLIKQFKPFSEVKVSFSTTMRPIIEAQPTSIAPISTSKFGTKSNLLRSEKHPTATKSVSSKHRPDYKSRSTDLKAFASEPNPILISAPVKANRKKSETVVPEKIETSRESSIQSPVSSSGLNKKHLILNLNSGRSNKLSAHAFKPKIASLSEKKVKTKTDVESPLKILPIQPFAWPNITESSFLSKVREAVKARLANVKPVQTSGTSRNSAIKSIPESDQDMARSASENKEVIACKEEPIKENVSYRCKMVCVREPIK